MRIGEREIGPDHKPYVIAEIGVNHDGEAGRALELVDAAAEAGADAVKLQYFETDRLLSKAGKLAAYQASAGETDPVEMLRRLELGLEECAAVIGRAHERGAHAVVTLFSLETVDAALALPWDAMKTASPDIVNRPLLEALAADGRPMIVSTGASTLEEVVRAVGDRQGKGWLAGSRDRLAVLQCVSSYPAEHEALGGIRAIAEATGLATGYSDHTRSAVSGASAVGAGACVLEKHLTDDRGRAGPDHAASLEPAGLARYVEAARRAWDAAGPGEARDVGPVEKVVLDCERDVREVSRQSLVATRDIAAGEVIGRDDLTVKRPGIGLEPWRVEEAVGSRAARAIGRDAPVLPADLA